MTTSELVLTLAGAHGVAGSEGKAAGLARGLLSACGPCEQMPLGSLICRVCTAPEDRPHILLVAHMDEIGMVVTHIDDNGFLRVGNCGGVDRATLPAAQIQVHTKDGILEGVVCTIPPHLNPDESKIPKMEEFSIDVGLDAETARERIQLGDRVSVRSEGCELLNRRVASKSIDDRGGCAAVILAARRLADCAPLGCSVSAVLSTLEEVGGQGAKTAAAALRPTHAIAVDVSFGYTPDSPKHKCGELGKGPMIGIAPVLDNRMFEDLKDTAKRHGLPYQIEVMGGETGTDADAVAVAGSGVRTGMVSIPLRYMHTPVEVVSAADVEAAADLLAAYVIDTFGGNG